MKMNPVLHFGDSGQLMLSPASILFAFIAIFGSFPKFCDWDCFGGAAFVGGKGNGQIAQGINEHTLNLGQSRLLERHSFGRGLEANRRAS
jgi:hypothetical protein